MVLSYACYVCCWEWKLLNSLSWWGEKEGTRVLSPWPVRVSLRHLCWGGVVQGFVRHPAALKRDPACCPQNSHPSLSCHMHGHIIWRRGEKKSVRKLPLNILKGGIIRPRKGRLDERQSLHWASTWGEGEGSILYTGLPSLRSHHALRAGDPVTEFRRLSPDCKGLCMWGPAPWWTEAHNSTDFQEDPPFIFFFPPFINLMEYPAEVT